MVFANKALSDHVKSVPVRGRVLAPLAARADRSGALITWSAQVLLLLLALFALPRSHLDGLEPDPRKLHGMQIGTTAAALGALGCSRRARIYRCMARRSAS